MSRFNGVTDYDVIVVGGQRYTANQLLDKQLFASKDTHLYKGDLKTIIRTIKAGQPLGRVYSYLKASISRPKSALELFDNPAYTGIPYYVLNEEDTIDTAFLKAQGTQNVSEEIIAEKEKQMKDNSPIEYYFKKYAGKVLLVGGGIYLVGKIGSEFIKAEVFKPMKKKESLAGLGTSAKYLLAGGTVLAVAGGTYLYFKKHGTPKLPAVDQPGKETIQQNLIAKKSNAIDNLIKTIKQAQDDFIPIKPVSKKQLSPAVNLTPAENLNPRPQVVYFQPVTQTYQQPSMTRKASLYSSLEDSYAPTMAKPLQVNGLGCLNSRLLN